MINQDYNQGSLTTGKWKCVPTVLSTVHFSILESFSDVLI